MSEHIFPLVINHQGATITRDVLFYDIENGVSLPEDLCHLLEQLHSSENIFAAAQHKWTQLFDQNMVRVAVEQTKKATSFDDPQYQEHFEYLIQVRKAGTLLLITHRLLTTVHKGPQPLSKFIASIGSWKDARDFPEIMQSRAEKIIIKLEQYLKDLKTAALPQTVSHDEFLRYYSERLGSLNELLSHQELTLDDYHVVRRIIRSFDKYYMLLAESAQSPDVLVVHQYLSKLSGNMGRFNDVFMNLEIEGLADIHESTTTIHPVHRQRIDTFISAHRR